MKVKLIPPSYYELVKHGFSLPHHLVDRKNEDNLPVLGGEYIVLEERDNDEYKWVIKTSKEYSSIYPTVFLPRFRKEMICPFEIGDRVLFSPKCTKEDLLFLNDLKGIEIEGEATDENVKKIHTIKYVLNRYYVFINSNFEMDEDGYIIKGFPFRWIDFVKSGDMMPIIS